MDARDLMKCCLVDVTSLVGISLVNKSIKEIHPSSHFPALEWSLSIDPTYERGKVWNSRGVFLFLRTLDPLRRSSP
jgi:hypothetical protein